MDLHTCPKCDVDLTIETYRFENGSAATICVCRWGHGAWVEGDFFTKMKDERTFVSIRSMDFVEEALPRSYLFFAQRRLE